MPQIRNALTLSLMLTAYSGAASAGGLPKLHKDDLKFHKDDTKINRHKVLPPWMEINRHDLIPPELEFSRHDIKDVFKPVGDELATNFKVVVDVPGEVIRTVGETGESIGHETERFAKKVEAETKRAGSKTEELAHATGHYLEGTARDYRDMLGDAARRIRDGKVLDAAWHLAWDPYKSTDARLADAVQESSYANAIAGSFASLAGPGGAAAYAAWYTYKQTGDVELALKAGIISGSLNATLSGVDAMNVDPGNRIPDMTKKAIIAGAVGAAAVAVAGGDEEAVRDGFLKSGGMMLVSDGYREYTGGRNLQEDAPPPSLGGYCALSMQDAAGHPGCAPEDWQFKHDSSGQVLRRSNPDGTPNPNGEPILDTPVLPQDHSYTGLAVKAGETGVFSENGPLMPKVSAAIPYLNAGSIAHDKVVVDLNLRGPLVQATIPPVIGVVMMGSPAGPQNAVTQEVIRSAGNPTPSGSMSPQSVPSAGRTPSVTLPPEVAAKIARDQANFRVWAQKEAMEGRSPPGFLPPAGKQEELTLTTDVIDPVQAAGIRGFLCFKGERAITPPVDGAVEAENTPSQAVKATATHELNVLSRSIFIAEGNAGNPNSCVVIVQGKEEADADVIAWTSDTKPMACKYWAIGLADQHLAQGWKCLVR